LARIHCEVYLMITSSLIMSREIIEVKTTYYYFQSPRKQESVLRDQSVVKNA